MANFFSTRGAQEARLNFWLAAIENNPEGDLLSLYALADWYEDNGSPKQSREVRKDAEKYQAENETGRTGRGESWLSWYIKYRLWVFADSLVKAETAFRRGAYGGNYDWNNGGQFARDDGSLEYAMTVNGYVPTLRRGRARQARLGRILTALGFRVFWRN